LKQEIGKEYDAVILAVNHKEFNDFNEDYFKEILAKDAVFFDIKGVFRNIINYFDYWSL
jgi:UDP-N-acetyl-D-galactosamine dehydrogenase